MCKNAQVDGLEEGCSQSEWRVSIRVYSGDVYLPTFTQPDRGVSTGMKKKEKKANMPMMKLCIEFEMSGRLQAKTTIY